MPGSSSSRWTAAGVLPANLGQCRDGDFFSPWRPGGPLANMSAHDEAKGNIFDYIECVYNEAQISDDRLSSAEFENQMKIG